MPSLADHYYRASLDSDHQWPALEEPTRARVCVIGGGFAGLNTALGLAERGVGEVVLLEAQRVGYGASGRNGGFVFGGFSRGEDALLRELGPARARDLYQGTLDAVELIRARIRRYGIDCEATEAGVIWANWFADPEVLRARQRLLAEHFGVEWQWWPRERLRERVRSQRYHDALFEPQAFHFHPLKYAQGIAAQAQALGVRVYEGSPALALERDGEGWRVRSERGEVRAEQVVLACGGYLAGLRREVDAAVMPIATYVMVTQPLGELLDAALQTRAAIYDSRFAFDYYRPLRDGRLLWGGRISVRDRSPQQVQALLYRDVLRVFPQLSGVRIDYAWSGLMSYARHQMPQIGHLGDGLWLAQAFGGHGVAPTTFAGELLAAAIAHGDERWRELSGYGLGSAFKPAGLAAAQLSYAWAQFKDWFKDNSERRDR
ncbi:NAD(P)/FAD-dependent oxidoreductase [Lysobacter enzymogenes]|uniref:FAD dependent oxidoreductase n=1 Tax=Lysobacter enzymogenes TaxID=69 RepID=A0AAU9AJZ0_LYSEN|nr:FAD-binding oxidoreductase [Lysobacter enzymogenes]BAV97600.1 FAD dependent oxidoreductase [Lysobacter enzymogenes]